MDVDFVQKELRNEWKDKEWRSTNLAEAFVKRLAWDQFEEWIDM